MYIYMQLLVTHQPIRVLVGVEVVDEDGEVSRIVA